jgi:hypothetical protein
MHAPLRRSQKRFGAKIVRFQPSESAAAVTHEERGGAVVDSRQETQGGRLWDHDFVMCEKTC